MQATRGSASSSGNPSSIRMARGGWRASSGIGFLLLLAIVFIAVLDRGQTAIRYFDWHAAAVVLGGVCGSVLMAFDASVFTAMIRDLVGVATGRDPSNAELDALSDSIEKLQSAWQEGRRSEALALAESGASLEIKTAAESLIQRFSGSRLTERFEFLRAHCQERLLPKVEGWDMVARLGPSFGIIGTVAGMVTLFRNMADRSGNLGGAMALALLATLYGILVGTAIGGPMSARANNALNRRLGLIDLLERQTAALIDDERGRGEAGRA